MPQKNKQYYSLGVDIGSISTKAVVIDQNKKILARAYLWTQGDPIQAMKNVLKTVREQLQERPGRITWVGATGSARNLIGSILQAEIVKNEITAHAIGALTLYPKIRTVLEIGGQDSKIIIIDKGIVADYAMNTLCAAGTGSFLTSQSKRLEINIKDFGSLALKSKNPAKIAGRCTVFAESDLVHKAQMGYPKHDIIAGLCNAVVDNYLNNVGKGKKILAPIIFQGGVSKNIGVVKAFEKSLNSQIIVDKNGHLMGAFGIAVIAQEQGTKKLFDFSIQDVEFRTQGFECKGCPNNCEIICVLKNHKFLDGWNNRCEVGMAKAKEHFDK
ncbi:MAG: 2-hydroxyglutaryl-CoA dehydratase [Candidatus Moranbacteria bacterium]|nr:2-hydroxyglutaryl-CoA dehydratase [Candidatus Moranbacteria bacterium]